MRNFLLILFFILPHYIFSQQVIFCEGVDHGGYPKNQSKEFTIAKDGGFVKVLVSLSKKVDSRLAVFDVYKVVDGKEIFDNSISMEVYPVLTWFFKEITFYKEGNYRVYVYDQKDKMLGVGEVRINIR